MCTLSIINNIDEIIITMNRDEHRQRDEENYLINNNNNADKINIVYPVDSQAGGSWFGCNEKGVVLALLNRYQDPVSENKLSRGGIITMLSCAGNLEQVVNCFGTLQLERYNPFDLFIISNYGKIRCSWNGRLSTIEEINSNSGYIHSSSFVDREKTLLWRQNYFNQWMSKVGNEKLNEKYILKSIHLQQDKKNLSRSILMSREHSHTKSICQAKISTSTLDFNYYPQKILNQLKDFSDFHSPLIQSVHMAIL